MLPLHKMQASVWLLTIMVMVNEYPELTLFQARRSPRATIKQQQQQLPSTYDNLKNDRVIEIVEYDFVEPEQASKSPRMLVSAGGHGYGGGGGYGGKSYKHGGGGGYGGKTVIIKKKIIIINKKSYGGGGHGGGGYGHGGGGGYGYGGGGGYGYGGGGGYGYGGGQGW